MSRFTLTCILFTVLLAACWGCGNRPHIVKVKYQGFSGIESEVELFELADIEPGLSFETRFPFTRAVFLYGRKHLDSATLVISEALIEAPSEWRLYFLLGRVENARQAWKDGERSFQTALRFAPPDKTIRALIYAAVAESLENQHDYIRARQHYATALKLDPGCKHARHGMERLVQLTVAGD